MHHNSVNTSHTLYRVILKALCFYSLIIYMIFSQSSSSTLYNDVINFQTESLSTSIKLSLKSSSSLKFIDFWRHLVQYLEHDDSVRKNELQSEFKEWWILTNYEQKNINDSQSSTDKFNWKHCIVQWDDHLHDSNE